MTRSLAAVTNIPAPYRLHLFEEIHKECLNRQIEFEVIFMAVSEPERCWPYEPHKLIFPHRIVKGVHPSLGGAHFHINPTIWSYVLKHPPTWLWIGGGWQMPTAFVLMLLRSVIPQRTLLLFHAEANHHFSQCVRGPIAALRRWILQRPDRLVVPGRVAQETIIQHWKVPNRQFISLPNIVDEQIYMHRVAVVRRRKVQLRLQYDLDASDFVMLFPARLHEPTKGNLNFLKAIAPLMDGRLKILLAGEGPDRSRIERWIAERDIPGIRLLGHKRLSEMVELLALADILVLPSFRDPNPLAAIEGLWASLPLLLSKRCGNWPEVLEPSGNGWLVDPERPAELRAAVAEALNMPADALLEFGRRSREIAQERFRSESVVRRFMDQLEHTCSQPSLM